MQPALVWNFFTHSPFLPFLLFWCSSHFYAKRNKKTRMDKFDQKCVISCGMQGNARNKNTNKCKNLFGVKSKLESIQRFARCRILPPNFIGRLCISIFDTYTSMLTSIIPQTKMFHLILKFNISCPSARSYRGVGCIQVRRQKNSSTL